METEIVGQSTSDGSVVYATLVNLGGAPNQDEGGDGSAPRLVVPHELSGHEMVSFAQIDPSAITAEMFQNPTAAHLQALQGIEYVQEADGSILVNTEGGNIVSLTQLASAEEQEQSASTVVVQSRITPNQDQTDFIAPPVPKGPHACKICNKIFPKWSQLMRHLKTHEDEQPFRCDVCNQAYNVESNLEIHKAIHQQPLQCPMTECSKLRFKRVASLKNHLTSHMKEESLICSECGDEFGLRSQLERHLIEHKQEQVEGVFECSSCQLEFQTLNKLKEHMTKHMKISRTVVPPMISKQKLTPYLRRSGALKRAKKTPAHYLKKCTFCGKRFAKPSQLERHLRTHTGERPYMCYICNKTFTQKGGLQLHIGTHKELRPYACAMCPMRFSQKGNLKAHIARAHHNPDNTFQCTECSCAFKRLGALNAHISRVHTSMVEQTDPDPTDTVSEITKSVIDQIVQDQDGSKRRQLKQTVAEILQGENVTTDIVSQAIEDSGLIDEASETNMDELREKLNSLVSQAVLQSASRSQSVNETSEKMTRVILSTTGTGLRSDQSTVRRVGGVRWHQCHYCTKEFKKPSDLVRHIRIHTNEKPFKCQQCNRAFSVASTLTAHLRTHTGTRAYRCDICNKHFTTSGSLKIHMRLHTGDKPFDCSECHRKFRTTGHLKTHQASHCRMSKISNTESSKTNQSSRLSKPDLTLHDIPLQEPIVITDSGLVQHPPRYSQLYQQISGETSRDRPYKCEYCTHAFKKSSHLKQHVRSHTGERPYSCVQCHKCFVSSGVLKAHMKTHSGVREYACMVCNNSFTTNGSLKRHLSTHTEIRPFMCPYCQKTFKTSVNCKKHMKTHKYDAAMMMLQQNSETIESTTTTTMQNIRTDPPNNQIIQSQNTISAGGALIGQFGLNDDIEDGTRQDIISDGQINQFFVTQNYTEGAPLSHNYIANTSQSSSLNQLNQFTGIDITGLTNHLSTSNFSNILSTNQTSDKNLQQPTTEHLSQNVNEHMSQTVTEHLSQTVTDQLQQSNTEHMTQGAVDHLQQSGVQQITQHVNEHIQQPLSGDVSQQMTGHLRRPASGSVIIETAIEESGTLEQYQHTDNQQQHITQNNLGSELSIQTSTGQSVVLSVPQERTNLVENGDIVQLYSCAECNVTFNNKDDLDNHNQTAHAQSETQEVVSEEINLNCPTCDKEYKSETALLNHYKTHQSKQYQCELCDTNCTSQSQLNKHMLTTHSQRKTIKCPQCGSFFHTQEDVMRHQQESHVTRIHNQQTLDTAKPMLSQSQFTQNADGSINIISEAAEHTHVTGTRDRTAKQNGVRLGTVDDQIMVSRKVLEESTLEKERTSEILDREKQNQELALLPKHANQCGQCPRSFKKPSDLLRHIRIHTGEKPFKCKHCDRTFTVKSTLISHLKTHFTAEKTYTCHICGSPFATKGTLKVHMRIHTGAKPFKCPHCSARFRTSGHRKTHVQSHFKHATERRGRKPTRTSWDPFANIQTQNIQQPNTNIQNIQQQPNVTQLENVQISLNTVGGQGTLQITGLDPNILGSTMLPIQIDSNLLAQLQAGTQSLNITLNPVSGQTLSLGAMPETGQLQENTTLQDNTLVQIQPQTELQPENTPQQEAPTLNEHHLQLDQVPNQTEVDEPTLTQPEQTEEASEESAVNIDDDNEEPRILIDTIPENALICQVCTQVTRDENELAEHLLIHDEHANIPRRNKASTLECQICGKICEKPSQMERHLRVHTGEKPFVCTVCCRPFSQKNSLQVHMTKHTGNKPYQCLICSNRFTQKGNMRTHMKRAHPDVTITHDDRIQSINTTTSADQETQEQEQTNLADAVITPNDTISNEQETDQYDLQLYTIPDTM